MALSTFIRQNLPGTTIKPSNNDRFDAYRQILISLPSNRYLSECIRMDKVRTAPSVNASGRASAKAAHFDTAFVVEDIPLYKSEGGLSGNFSFYSTNITLNLFLFVGLRVAQIQLIFNLPPQFGFFRHPLAYIEWFMPLGSMDHNTGLYSITRSTRQARRNAEDVISWLGVVRIFFQHGQLTTY